MEEVLPQVMQLMKGVPDADGATDPSIILFPSPSRLSTRQYTEPQRRDSLDIHTYFLNLLRPDFKTTAPALMTRPPLHTAVSPHSRVQAMRSAHLFDGC